MAIYSSQSFVSAQYLKNQLVEFHQILYMHLSWQDLAWDCYTSFFANSYQSYGPSLTPNFVSAQYLETYLIYFHKI